METPKYAKVFKWIEIALLVISVALAVWAFTQFGGSGKETAVEGMLYWAYAMLAVTLVLVIGVALFIDLHKNETALENNPVIKRPVKTILYAVGIVAALVCAYLFASGSPALGLTTATPPTDGELKLTDTVLNLTYICGAGAIIAIIAGEIISSILNKKA